MAKKIRGLPGMIGVVLFTLSFTIHGWWRPDYDPVQNYISELAIGASGWIQVASFWLLGVAVVCFAMDVRRAVRGGKASRVVPMLLAIVGIGYVLSGVFVTDPQAMFDNQQTLHGVIHGVVGAVVFSLSMVCCFVFWRRFRMEAQWKPMAVFSFMAGVAMAVLIVLMKIGQLQVGLLHDWAGVIQRCCLLISYVWIFLLSFRIKRQCE